MIVERCRYYESPTKYAENRSKENIAESTIKVAPYPMIAFKVWYMVDGK